MPAVRMHFRLKSTQGAAYSQEKNERLFESFCSIMLLICMEELENVSSLFREVKLLYSTSCIGAN